MLRLLPPSKASSRRLTGLLAALASGLTLCFALPAYAGQYDYNLSVASGYYDTRSVVHDYRYLRSNLSGAGTCVVRGGGQPFCGSGTADHHYTDSCGSCYSFYYNGDTIPRILGIHDEWV